MPSTLITSMRNPGTANFIEWWPLHPSGEQITLRNQILFLDRLVIPFQQDDPYRHIAEYKAHSGDGDPVSEWHVTRGSLQSYLTKSASA